MIDVNPAKVGVDNPVRRRKGQHPFESWAELEALAAAIGPRYGPIDRHYGHLARDGRAHAIKLLDASNAPEFRPMDAGARSVDAETAGRRHA